MSNIVSNRYTFNALVTALHESLQLENEIFFVDICRHS